MRKIRKPIRYGLTLLELVIVLAILVALAGIVTVLGSNLLADSREDVTRQSLHEIRNVIANMYWDDMGEELPKGGRVYPQLCFLLMNPDTYQDGSGNQQTFDPTYRRGWRGPYFTPQQGSTYQIDADHGFSNYYGENGDPAILDGWGNPIVIQNPTHDLADAIMEDVRLVSAGGNGIIDIDRQAPSIDLDRDNKGDVGDDVWISFELRR
jgi:prepilin-type N-terminal cleavage/methylation domain-containing protein